MSDQMANVEQPVNEPVKVKRPRGRPRKENKLTPAERQREYMKNPEYREKHRVLCENYNNRMKKMREFCKNNNVEL